MEKQLLNSQSTSWCGQDISPSLNQLVWIQSSLSAEPDLWLFTGCNRYQGHRVWHGNIFLRNLSTQTTTSVTCSHSMQAVHAKIDLCSALIKNINVQEIQTKTDTHLKSYHNSLWSSWNTCSSKFTSFHEGKIGQTTVVITKPQGTFIYQKNIIVQNLNENFSPIYSQC